MSSSPSDNVRRQNDHGDRDSKQALHEGIYEDDQMNSEVPHPILHPTNMLVIAKWRIRSAYYYLTFNSALCLAAILINPSNDVRLVALAVLASSSALGGALLRGSYRKV